MTYTEWKKLPSVVEVDCPAYMMGHAPYPYYIDVTSLGDADHGKRVFVKGLYEGPLTDEERKTLL